MYLLDLFGWLIWAWPYLPLIDLDIKLEWLCDPHTEDSCPQACREEKRQCGGCLTGQLASTHETLQSLMPQLACMAAP